MARVVKAQFSFLESSSVRRFTLSYQVQILPRPSFTVYFTSLLTILFWLISTALKSISCQNYNSDFYLLNISKHLLCALYFMLHFWKCKASCICIEAVALHVMASKHSNMNWTLKARPQCTKHSMHFNMN